jgi:hypothetical protein
LFDERSLLDFVKFNALPGLFAAGYVAVTQYQGTPTTWYGTLVAFAIGVLITYGIRRTHVKGNLLKGLDDRISSFENVALSFLDLCHRFEINPEKQFENYVDNSHDLIVKHWLDLLKRVRVAFRQQIDDENIAALMKEFLRIVQQHRESVVLSFINRANKNILVTTGTKDKFESLRTKYNDLVTETSDLIKDMNSKLKIKQGIQERAAKITEGLQVQEEEPQVQAQ